jgi:hypothetical protein
MSVFARWMAGRGARIVRSPTAPVRAAGLLGYYHPVLEPIGDSLNVWRLRTECDRDYAFRIAVTIAERLNQLDADLDRVINYDKR